MLQGYHLCLFKLPDENIYWMINHQRFDQHLRDQELVNAVARKLDQVSLFATQKIIQIPTSDNNFEAKVR